MINQSDPIMGCFPSPPSSGIKSFPFNGNVKISEPIELNAGLLKNSSETVVYCVLHSILFWESPSGIASWY